jgi:CRISPR/Cas system-associated exonuclease Cas4 (RecB family)
MEDMRWKKDSLIDHEYYESLKVGLNFHLMCERYFGGIPVGIDISIIDNFSKETKTSELPIQSHDNELLNWYIALREKFPIEDENIYLPEHEIKMQKDNIKLQAKFDLIILKPNNKIEIWDWKTENRKLQYKELNKRIQAIVYMYVLGEKASEVFGRNIPFENITMNFWQPQYKDDVITIDYSDSKHRSNEENIMHIINRLENYDFHIEFNKELYYKQCQYCEFNYFCNNEVIDFNKIEDDIIDDASEWDDIEEIN